MTSEEYLAEMRDIHSQLVDVAQAMAAWTALGQGFADEERVTALFKRQVRLLRRAVDCDEAIAAFGGNILGSENAKKLDLRRNH